LDAGDALDPAILAFLHRAIEQGALLRMLGEPLPEVSCERLPAACVQVGDRAVPDAAEQLGEGSPGSVRAELSRRRGVLENAGVDLGEDPLARKRAQVAVQRVG